MGDIGDYWREAREDRQYYDNHGHWPGQKLCKLCGKAFRPAQKGHDKCRHCAQAWSQGYVLVGKGVQDGYVPNYSIACIVCDQRPTVDFHAPGEAVHHTELCGPCCFGEAACIDPKEW